MDFETLQEKIEMETDMMEKQMVDEKAWYLRGEISAAERVENTVLEQHLDVQRHGKFKPQPANEENILQFIYDAIKQNAFDSPVLKSKPKASVESKPPELHETVQKSLVEDYENLLLNKNILQKTQQDPVKQAIQTEMIDLFDSLDSLANLHTVPYKRPLEVTVIQNSAALTNEELGPSTTSTANLLAPEEVCAPRGEVVKGRSELTLTDKRRHRRKLMRIRSANTASRSSSSVRDKNAAMAKVIRMAHKPGTTKSQTKHQAAFLVMLEIFLKCSLLSMKERTYLRDLLATTSDIMDPYFLESIDSLLPFLQFYRTRRKGGEENHIGHLLELCRRHNCPPPCYEFGREKILIPTCTTHYCTVSVMQWKAIGCGVSKKMAKMHAACAMLDHITREIDILQQTFQTLNDSMQTPAYRKESRRIREKKLKPESSRVGKHALHLLWNSVGEKIGPLFYEIPTDPAEYCQKLEEYTKEAKLTATCTYLTHCMSGKSMPFENSIQYKY